MITILKLMMLGIALHASVVNALSGNEIMQMSKDNQLAYVIGVSDLYKFYNNNNITCIPKEVTYNQLSAIFNKYLNSHPQDWHYDASTSVVASIVEAFPCPPKTKTSTDPKF